MISRGSTSNAWPGYVTMVTVNCDLCGDTQDDIHEDEYNADQSAEYDGWGVGISLEGSSYEHICGSCMEELHYCEVCGDAFNHDSGCYCCTESLCSEYCALDYHDREFQEDTRLEECEECELPNPHYRVLGKCNTTAASWQL